MHCAIDETGQNLDRVKILFSNGSCRHFHIRRWALLPMHVATTEMFTHFRLIVQDLDDRLHDQVVPVGVGVPAVSLEGKGAECLDRPVH